MKEASAKYVARPRYKQTEVGVIPGDWICSTVAQVAANRSNAIVGGPFGSDLVSKDYVATGIPVVRGQNMARKSVSGDFVFVSESKAKYLQANMARVDDIIFTQRGTLGQVSIVPSEPFEKYLISQSQMKLTLNSDVASSLFVYQYFISTNGQRQILNSAIQTGVPHTNLGILRSYRIPLPPTKAEQEAIAEALSDADALIESLEQLLAKKRQLKQGAMRELLTSKKRLPGFSGEWRSIVLKRLLRIPVTDGPHLTPKFLNDGVPFLSVNNLVGNRIDLSDPRYISRKDHAEFSRKCKPQKGDILLGKAASVGLVAVVDFDMEFNIWSPIALIRVSDENVPKFIYYSFQTRGVIRQIELLTNSSSQGNIAMGDIERLVLLLPKQKEQQAVADALSDIDADIAEVEAKLTKTRQLKQGMMQELLTGRIRLI